MTSSKTFRIAGILLIAVMLTMSIVSGTFAKYVTSGSVGDSARVAKFGVTIETDGELFANTYIDATGGNTPKGSGTLTVQSTDKVLAPGTKSSAEGMSFSVTGTPEVAVKVKVEIDKEHASDVWLGIGISIPDLTNDDGNTFTNSTPYYPIKYTLWNSKNGYEWDSVSTGNLETIITYLETNMNGTTVYEAGQDLSQVFGSYKLTWEWAYGLDDGVSDTDRLDVVLGNLAAGMTETYNESYHASHGYVAQAGNYSIDAELKFTITVTQVD